MWYFGDGGNMLAVIVTGVVLLVLVCVAWSFAELGGVIQKLEAKLRQKQEFIDKHLLVVNFQSQHYVFPYVDGTNQKEVLFLLSNPRASKALYETVSAEEAKKRIIEMHQTKMKELDRLGV